MLNAYLSTMTRIVQLQRGTIDKYIGDAIMAFWNAPVDLSDHASRAVQTALEMIEMIDLFNAEQASAGKKPIRIGIGIATGCWLGGKRAMIAMQSSGVGNCINMLSVMHECRFPLLMIVTMRGEWGEFNPWQLAMGQGTPPATEFRALVFSKTLMFRHASITNGIAAIKQLGSEHRFHVDATEDASAFSSTNLAKYKVVIFLSTSGDILNDEQQTAFREFIERGGGLVGIHAAVAGDVANFNKAMQARGHRRSTSCAVALIRCVLPSPVPP